MKTLRPYQSNSLKALFQYLFTTVAKNPLIVAPVGAGKSLMIAEFIKQLHDKYPRARILMLTHVKELLEQNAEELVEQYFGCDFGFYCAGLKQKRLHNDVTFASIQSIAGKIGEFKRIPEIIVIDECHLISHKNDTQYRQFIDEVMAINPNCRVIGFTGTPFRADTGRLDAGKNKLFDGVAYEISMGYMIEQGYWARPMCPEIAAKIDVSGVKVVGGDYQEKALQEAVNKPEINDACIKELIEKGVGRKRWLLFTAGVEHCEEVTQRLNDAGISARFVHSKQDSSINDQNLKDHKAGLFTALINVAKLTTGYNDPYIDLLAFMRPTRSPVLYIQTIGRGVRPVYADGFDLSTTEGRLNAIAASIKPDCMILDFGQVVATLGAIDQVSIKKEYLGEEEGEVGEAPFKVCPEDETDRNGQKGCGEICAPAQRYCFSCGYCFIKLDKEASNKAIVSTDQQPEWIDVHNMYLDVHYKQGGMPSMKVSYATQAAFIREWVCFEHHTFEVGNNKRYAWDQAVKWHKKRLPDVQVPNAVDDAVAMPYPTPKRIFVKPKGKYWEILDYEFEEETEHYPPEININHDKEPDDDDYFEIPF